MPQEVESVLLDCLGRAVQDGLPFEGEKIERAIVDHVQGKRITTTLRMRAIRFLDEVRWRRDYFTHEESVHADALLRSITKGHHYEPPSSFALAIPPGQRPELDVLIYQPRQALEDLYFTALHQNVGSPSQRETIEKMLWLRPLDADDYKAADAFFEELSRRGIRGKTSELAQARFLLDLLAPGSDPHALVKKLKASGLPKRIRKITGPPPMVSNPPAVSSASLDDLLVNLSSQIREAADEGDTHRVQKLLTAARNVTEAVGAMKKSSLKNTPAVLTAIKGQAAQQARWETFNQIAANPLINAALIPLGVVEHVLAGIVMGELSPEESWDEVTDVLGGSVIIGGSIWGTGAALSGIYKLVADKKLGALLRKISERAPPRVKAYLVPAVFLSAFTFIALRQSQGDLAMEEAGEYRWRFLEEMAEAFGIQLAVTGGGFWTIRFLFNRWGKIPNGKIGGAGMLALATGAGMLAQEIFSSWRRKKFRQDLKEKTYLELVKMLDTLPGYPAHLKPKLQTRIDRKFSMLIALNVLEFPSVKEAIAMAEERQRFLERMTSHGMSEEMAIHWISSYGRSESLSPQERAITERWIQKMAGKETTSTLPVGMLPAQKRRIVALWKKDLSDVIQFTAAPIPVPVKTDARQQILEDQFEDWNLAHTLSLFRHYIELRASDQMESLEPED